jgi:hypothetical protein
VNADGSPSLAGHIPQWDTRVTRPIARPGERDFGTWHKGALPHDAYCMDVDKIEYRIDAAGNLRVVGMYELIRWGWSHELDDIPTSLAPYAGKVALLGRISAGIAAGQRSSFPTFFVWHRPDLSEFVVCRLEDWVGAPGRALGLGAQAFADLISGLPRWDGRRVASRPAWG